MSDNLSLPPSLTPPLWNASNGGASLVRIPTPGAGKLLRRRTPAQADLQPPPVRTSPGPPRSPQPPPCSTREQTQLLLSEAPATSTATGPAASPPPRPIWAPWSWSPSCCPVLIYPIIPLLRLPQAPRGPWQRGHCRPAPPSPSPSPAGSWNPTLNFSPQDRAATSLVHQGLGQQRRVCYQGASHCGILQGNLCSQFPT